MAVTTTVYDQPKQRKRKPLADRFWPKVDADGDCWEWTGAIDSFGYGRITAGGARGAILFSHRVAYELLVDPIPDGMQIDHLCRNRKCVNPDHLQVVTCGENIKRGMAPNMVSRREGRCRRGHDYAEHGRIVAGYMRCMTCVNERRRELYPGKAA